MITHRDAAQTASRSVERKPLSNSFTIRVPQSTSEIPQGQSPDEADDQQMTQSGCISRYAVIAIEQQQIITIAVCAAWAASPEPDATDTAPPRLRCVELLGESYFAALGDEAMAFLESATITGFFELDDES